MVVSATTGLNASIPEKTYDITPIATTTVQAVTSNLPVLPLELMKAGGCESNDSPDKKPRQFNKDGSVVTHKNKNGSTDYGSFQINDIHLPQAKKLGLDFINSEEDNYKMAAIIYSTQGIKAWAGYNSKTKNCSYYR